MTLALRTPSATVVDSPLARWDGRWKLAALAGCCVATALLYSPVSAALAFAFALILCGIGRIPSRTMVSGLGLVGLTMVPVLVVVPLSLPVASPDWQYGPLTFSWYGVVVAITVTFRALAIAAFGLAMIHTAPIPDTLAAAHALRLPGALVQIARLAFHYAFVLAAEARRTHIALRTRGFRPGTNGHTYRTMGNATAGLLVQGADRAERVSAAMRCRGFDGTFRTTAVFQTRTADLLSFLAVLGCSIGLVVADRLWLSFLVIG